MALGVIEIEAKEYNKLMELKGKVESFENYIKEHDYIDRKDCAIILGFGFTENKKENNKDAGTD